MGQYYLQKGENLKALDHYTMALEKDPENFEIIKNTLELQVALKHFDKADKLSSTAMELFPAQAVVYLLNGKVKNGLKRYAEAVEALEMGLDYIIDNVALEIEFYQQLYTAHRALGNNAKAEAFANKAKGLQNKE